MADRAELGRGERFQVAHERAHGGAGGEPTMTTGSSCMSLLRVPGSGGSLYACQPRSAASRSRHSSVSASSAATSSAAGSARDSATAWPAHIATKSGLPAFAAAARSLPVSAALRRERKLRRRASLHLAHEAIGEAARRLAGKFLGDQGLVLPRGEHALLVDARRAAFRAGNERRAELRGLRAERQRGGDAGAVHDAARGDDRRLHPAHDRAAPARRCRSWNRTGLRRCVPR